MLWIGLLWVAGPVAAHPVSLTTALVDLDEGEIRMELDVMVEDLVLFYDLEPETELTFSMSQIQREADRHHEFLLRHIHLRDLEGNPLPGRVARIDFSELPEEGVHWDDLMMFSMIYHLEFDLPENLSHLTVAQDFGGEDPLIPSEMEVRLFHDGVFQEAAQLSHRTSHTFEIDWETDWSEMAGDMEAARQRLRDRQEETLGITSYSAVYSYLYVTPRGVRFEILIPLLTLESWVPVRREAPEMLTVDEQQAAAGAILEFLTQHSNVEINGQPVEAQLDRIDFFGPDFRDFAMRAPAVTVNVFSARVGAVLEYPAEASPREVMFEWDFYDDRLHYLRPRIFVYEEAGRDVLLDFARTKFQWEGRPPEEVAEFQPLAPPLGPSVVNVPVLSGLLLAGGFLCLFWGVWKCGSSGWRRSGLATALLWAVALVVWPVGQVAVPVGSAPPPDASAARQTMAGLLHNLYRSFEYREEEAIYDSLAQSVSGDLLEDLYLQIRRNLEMADQGSALARLEELEIVDGEILHTETGPGRVPVIDYLATWTVRGSLEHWGHVHSRLNQYQARFRLSGGEEGWRIEEFEPLDEERLEMRIRIRS